MNKLELALHSRQLGSRACIHDHFSMYGLDQMLVVRDAEKWPICLKNRICLPMLEMQVQSLGWEGPLEKGMATHNSILAWRIPWTEGPGGLQSMGSQRAGQD